ncbi:MFS general substrate transporter [Schizopora paradoxa]|uniref:MFS general substrate transporter n=1 Tax=Schizopora paradoxa TaxID=27342 RepID=A0A0H2RM09_9AGAM|nr:MFS general substrate transporter [Schizopora paradoxa]
MAETSPPANGSDDVSSVEKYERGGKFDFNFLPIPARLQYDSRRPFSFTPTIAVTFGVASTFTAMNLFYCQPLLLQFSEAFNVSHQEVSRIPTLVQAGYAAGLLLITPLGDLLRRRPMLLAIVTASSALTIGLAVTKSFVAFEVLNFFVGVATVTPPILLPFAADIAPPQKRASAIAIVLSGLLFGVLLARVLAGVIGNFVTWRVVYYLAIGLQFGVLALLYLVLPDWPAKNEGQGVTYFGILATMAKYAVTEPVLIQSSFMQFAASACYANFWVTLTFLLGGPPYNYSTLDIGLFGLVGMFGVACGPIVGHMIDKVVPWYATLLATFIQLVFQGVQLGAGGINVAAVVLACIGLDVGRQMQQVSLTTSVYAVSASARSRLNAVLIISIFVGQVVGTAVGTTIFTKFGWRPAAGFSMGLFVFQFAVLLLRGPHCERYTWFGYENGTEPRKAVYEEKRKRKAEMEAMERGQRGQKEMGAGGDGGESEKASHHEGEKSQDGEVEAQTTDLAV